MPKFLKCWISVIRGNLGIIPIEKLSLHRDNKITLCYAVNRYRSVLPLSCRLMDRLTDRTTSKALSFTISCITHLTRINNVGRRVLANRTSGSSWIHLGRNPSAKRDAVHIPEIQMNWYSSPAVSNLVTCLVLSVDLKAATMHRLTVNRSILDTPS